LAWESFADCLLLRVKLYEANAYEKKTCVAHMIVLRLVSDLREAMPMVGTRKILYKIEPMLKAHGIKMGRHQLFDLLRFHGLLIRRRKRGCIVTTNSYHWLKKYPNLVEHIEIYALEQVWVADITYVKTAEGYSYLSLIRPHSSLNYLTPDAATCKDRTSHLDIL
jgi:putative transposase